MDFDDESITFEEKQRLQKDAGIPHLPTNLTYKLRVAVCGEDKDNFFSYDYMWTDKPHRLVYDACREIERQQIEIERLREALTFYAEIKNWKVKWINGVLTSESKPTAYEDSGQIARAALKEGK
jgi:hypothetical protein